MDQADPHLGPRARALIDDAKDRSELRICPVSWWEVQNGVERNRIRLSLPIDHWRADLIAAGYQERPITGVDTILQARLPHMHKDPADRLLVAVAINGGIRLLTADEKLLAWPGRVDRFDCRL